MLVHIGVSHPARCILTKPVPPSDTLGAGSTFTGTVPDLFFCQITALPGAQNEIKESRHPLNYCTNLENFISTNDLTAQHLGSEIIRISKSL